jgi:hypothetical protein
MSSITVGMRHLSKSKKKKECEQVFAKEKNKQIKFNSPTKLRRNTINNQERCAPQPQRAERGQG